MDDREKLSFWIDRTLADAVRQKLLDHKRATRERITITDICTEALQQFINPKEGNEMENKIYAVNAEEGWQGGNQLYTVHGYTTAFDGMIIVTDITEDELENDDAVTYYREVTVVEPNSKIAEAAKPCVYFPPEDKMGYGIIF